MIIKRTWLRKKGLRTDWNYGFYRWTGWFLFGILPIYLIRYTITEGN